MIARITPAHWRIALPFCGLVLCVLLGMLVPIYTDETGWRFQERAGFDGLDILLNDVCGPNTLARPPWFIMPVRMFSALANGALADPIFIRVEGVLCALAWLGMLWVLVGATAPDAQQRMRLRSLAFSLLGLGVLPFLLVLSRPEQAIILAVTAALLVSRTWQREGAPALAWGRAAVIAMLTAVALSYHLKGVLYAPVMLVALGYCARGKRTLAPRLIGAGAIVALTVMAARYWIGRLACPDNPLIAAAHGRENIFALFAGDGSFLDKLRIAAAGTNPLRYVLPIVPTAKPHSAWLPVGVFPSWLADLFASAMLVLWGAAILLGLRALFLFAAAERWRALRNSSFSLSVTIFAVVLAWAFSQLNKNFYEAAHVLPMLTVFVVLSLSLHVCQEPDRWFALALRVAPPLALASQVIVAGFFIPPLLAATRTPGYVDGQPFSVSAKGYAGVRRNIGAAMRGAGIAPDRRSRRLVLDELTYLALQGTRLPLHRMGVLSVTDGSMPDPVGYMRSRGSDGIVAGCRYLEPAMLAVASRSGAICAISAAGLARLDAGTRANRDESGLQVQ